jgi:hypothetical protein
MMHFECRRPSQQLANEFEVCHNVCITSGMEQAYKDQLHEGLL